MKRILVTLLVFGLIVFAGCSGGMHSCTATGLVAGRSYSYDHVDSEGHEYSGEFTAQGSTYEVPDVPNSIDCSSLQIEMVQLPYSLA